MREGVVRLGLRLELLEVREAVAVEILVRVVLVRIKAVGELVLVGEPVLVLVDDNLLTLGVLRGAAGACLDAQRQGAAAALGTVRGTASR